MDVQLIDLTLFSRRYRQALLYTMIEGLMSGLSFSFIDDRDPEEIESELREARLDGYRWFRHKGQKNNNVAYVIERDPATESDGCCGCNCSKN